MKGWRQVGNWTEDFRGAASFQDSLWHWAGLCSQESSPNCQNITSIFPRCSVCMCERDRQKVDGRTAGQKLKRERAEETQQQRDKSRESSINHLFVYCCVFSHLRRHRHCCYLPLHRAFCFLMKGHRVCLTPSFLPVSKQKSSLRERERDEGRSPDPKAKPERENKNAAQEERDFVLNARQDVCK